VNATEWALVIGAVSTLAGTLIGHLSSARTAARKSDLDLFIAQASAREQQDRDEFERLTAEIERLEKTLDRRRIEIETLYAQDAQQRKELESVRAENSALRSENNKLRDTVTELEKQIAKPGTGPLVAPA